MRGRKVRGREKERKGKERKDRLTVAIVTHPGNNSLGSSKPPEKVRMRSVRKALVMFIVRSRIIVAEGV